MKSKSLPAYCTSGRKLEELGGIVIHYFSCSNVDPEHQHDMHCCWNLFCDLNRPRDQREHYLLEDNWPEDRMYASAHVLISREGEVWKLVDFDRQAYHAGRSAMNGREHCNRWTIGIELLGGPTTGFTAAQYDALAELCLDLGVDKRWIAGHDSVRWEAIQAGKASKRKNDPSGRSDGMGTNFAWDELYELIDLKRTQAEQRLESAPSGPAGAP